MMVGKKGLSKREQEEARKKVTHKFCRHYSILCFQDR